MNDFQLNNWLIRLTINVIADCEKQLTIELNVTYDCYCYDYINR